MYNVQPIAVSTVATTSSLLCRPKQNLVIKCQLKNAANLNNSGNQVSVLVAIQRRTQGGGLLCSALLDQ